MVKVYCFTFNPFQENTYVLADKTGECVIIDPGCFDREEKAELKAFIEENQLKPVKLLNTHCHIDHVLGNRFVADTWKLGLEMNKNDLSILKNVVSYGQVFGVNGIEESPEPTNFINEGDKVHFGETVLDVVFVPGHAPGHVAFIEKNQKIIISGDVLFRGSIGRTDLPGGDFDTLIRSIKTKLFPLGDDFVVYPGHGQETTIGEERKFNPFCGENR